MPDPSPSRLPWRRARRAAADRRHLLESGEAVELPCRARRTTARGWGEWIEGRLRLPGPEGGTADVVADHPHEVALVTRRGETPVALEPPLEVVVRDVRYRAEAFHGPAAEIITVTSSRRVVEIALPPDQSEAVARRLATLTPPP